MVGVAKATLQKLSTWISFSRPGLRPVEWCSIGQKESVALLFCARVTPLDGVNALVQPHLGLPSHTPSGACVARIMDYWLRQLLSNSWVAPCFGISLRQPMRRDSM